MDLCSVAGCKEKAVKAWGRVPTDEELEAHAAYLNQRQSQNVQDQRLGLRVRIAALVDAQNNTPESLSPADTRAFRARVQRQIDELQVQHDALTFRSITVQELREHEMIWSAFHCAGHQHEDQDWYARVHDSGCSALPDCGCSS